MHRSLPGNVHIPWTCVLKMRQATSTDCTQKDVKTAECSDQSHYLSRLGGHRSQ